VSVKRLVADERLITRPEYGQVQSQVAGV
jgi:hypothetical protein